MSWLNYNHLYYFWMVAREGSIARASEELHVSQPTVSAQVKDLEAALKRRLFDRAGRGLALTDAGKVAFNYANEMFSLAEEMLNALEREPSGPLLKLAVGILDVIPKHVVRQLLAPAMQLPDPPGGTVRLICREGKADRLLSDLAARRTDMVLSDSPISTAIPLQGFDHLLGESQVSLLASRELAVKASRGFPKSLEGMPFLLPTDHTAMRRALNMWFDRKKVHPHVLGEFDDSATMYSFGSQGAGVFPAPALVAAQVQRAYNVHHIITLSDVRERYYAITLQEKLKHPAVLAVTHAARRAFTGSKATNTRH